MDNEVSKIDDYRNTIYELFPSLQVLDGKDRDDNSFYSDDLEELDEEGEAEQLEEIINNLDPETREKFEKGELNEEDLRGMGLIPMAGDESYGDEDDDEADYGDEEEGEDASDDGS